MMFGWVEDLIFRSACPRRISYVLVRSNLFRFPSFLSESGEGFKSFHWERVYNGLIKKNTELR